MYQKIKSFFESNTPEIMSIIAIIALAYIAITTSMQCNDCKELTKYVKYCQMYDKKINFNGEINGMYFTNDELYCVMTKDQLPGEIFNTDCHERLHALLYQDEKSYKHFCNITKWD